jgi:hypothetical protein
LKKYTKETKRTTSSKPKRSKLSKEYTHADPKSTNVEIGPSLDKLMESPEVPTRKEILPKQNNQLSSKLTKETWKMS